MLKIQNIRPVLLSAPYAHAESLEVRIHLNTGYRTTGMVEVTLSDGTTGLGEGYLAVFAPRVFESIVNLLSPYLVGARAFDITSRYRDMCRVCDYWSMSGAARHVISAVEIALLDAKSKSLGVPAYSLLGGKAVERIRMYGSGGDSPTPQLMQQEIDDLTRRSIGLFKIRARNHEAAKTAWVLERAAAAGIQVAVDMTQNLANPAQTVSDVMTFLADVRSRSRQPIVFLEEALGPLDARSLPLLRAQAGTKVVGGETLTTATEICHRIQQGCYDFSQPDATVIGGVGQVMEVFAAGRQNGVDTVVHCWGGPVGMMANYHAAFAGGGLLVEWPMPAYALRSEMLVEPLKIEAGCLVAPTAPGLGANLAPEIEQKYPFRADAVYQCLGVPISSPPDIWKL